MTWLPFYREVAQVLSTYENRQSELLDLLRAMQSAGLKTISLDDIDENEQTVPLAEIDPFTFLATFHRTGDEMRFALWNFLREKWNLSEPIPQSLAGLPTVMANASWFIPWKKFGRDGDVAALWKVFQSAHLGLALPQEAWARALQIDGVGVAKLTSGLFWTNAEKFVSLDSVMLKYLARYGIAPNINTVKASVAEYEHVLEQIHETLGYDHIHLSREAWETRNAVAGTKRYWAGGHDFGAGYGGPQKERFLREGIWQANFLDGDQKNLTNQMRAMFEEIQIGDEFAIKGCGADNLQVHALGRVTEIVPNEYLLKLDLLSSRPLYRGKRPIGVGAGNWTQTLLEVKRPEDIELIFHGRQSEKPSPIVQDLPLLPLFPLNQILYGPPGTGKTYSSISRAVEIIDGAISDDRAQTVARFEELRAAHRIGFVTFHQSFAYEEFVEGLRPVLDDDADSTARYEISDGVFKQMALRALAACLRQPLKPAGTGPAFEQLWVELMRRIEENPEYKIAGLGNSEYLLTPSPTGGIYGENLEGKAKAPYFASRKNIQQVWDALPEDTTPNYSRISTILQKGSHHFLIGAIIVELRRIATQDGSTLATSTPFAERAVTVEDAGEWLNAKSDLEKSEGAAPRYVLIIDEINRGNIAKIFGELITLLENDKRLGSLNELRVMLPYSKETFSVPGNLYLLGTMNTADKSLALLDIALRRRFEFEELRPNFAVCEKLNNAMREVLAALNARLMRVLDREHRLGHAPWIDVQTPDEWNRVFLKQIVPLLQEYFYNDWDNLRAVLGESGKGEIVRELSVLDGMKSRTRYAWWFDCNENPLTPDFLGVLAKNFKIADAPPLASSQEAPSAQEPALQEPALADGLTELAEVGNE